MPNYHLIMDFETMGQDPVETSVIDCSFYVFDWNRFLDDRYTVEELRSEIQTIKLDVTDQIKRFNSTIDPQTLNFWRTQSKQVRDRIKPKPTDVTVEQFTTQFSKYISDFKISHWWSRSNTFDPIILYQLYKRAGVSVEQLHKSLKWYSVRDIRTFIDTKFNFQLNYNSFTPSNDPFYKRQFEILENHNSVDDVISDLLRMQYITEQENK